MKKTFFLSTVALLSLGMLAGCSGEDPNTIKVWCDEKVVEVTTKQLNAWKAANPDSPYNFKVEPVGEGAAAGNMINDPKAGADVYFFAQDQLARLVTAQAITALPSQVATTVANLCDAGSIAAATAGDKLYAYPATSDNTFFMYYRKSDFNGVDMTKLEDIIAAIPSGKKFYAHLTNAWYNAAFFYAVGAESTWTTNARGDFTDYEDTYETKGLAAMKALNALEMNTTKVVYNDDKTATSYFKTDASVVISGTWGKADAVDALGEDLGVAVLPSFTVDGESYQLKPFGGFKLVGTKPQASSDKAAAVSSVALYLTNKASSLERFSTLGWVPSNKEAQADPSVQSDEVTKVLLQQMALSTPQGQYPDGWWDIAAALANNLHTAKTDNELKSALSAYNTQIDALVDR